MRLSNIHFNIFMLTHLRKKPRQPSRTTDSGHRKNTFHPPIHTIPACRSHIPETPKTPFSHAIKPVPPSGKAYSTPQKSLFRNTEKPLSHHQKARSAPPESPLRKPSTYNTLSHRHLHTSSENHIFQPKTLARHEKRSHPDVQFNTCRIIITPTRTRSPALIPSPFPLLTLPPSHRLALFFILFNHPTI